MAESKERPRLAQYLLENIIIAGCIMTWVVFSFHNHRVKTGGLPRELSNALVLNREQAIQVLTLPPASPEGFYMPSQELMKG